jgi:hypothetical protein
VWVEDGCPAEAGEIYLSISVQAAQNLGFRHTAGMSARVWGQSIVWVYPREEWTGETRPNS